jgi:hypothetical protein
VNKQQEGDTHVNCSKKPINPIPNKSLLQACSSEIGGNIKGKRTKTSVDGNEGECEWNFFFHHLVAEELIFVLPCSGLSEQAL